MNSTKPWYQSRLILVGATALLGALADGLASGWDVRQIVIAAIGALVVVLRADTTKEITK